MRQVLSVLLFLTGALGLGLGALMGWQQIFDGHRSATTVAEPIVLLVVGGAIFAVGMSVEKRWSGRRLAVSVAIVIVAVCALTWLVVTEKPRPCADQFTEADVLPYFQSWLLKQGYDPDVVASFKLDGYVKDEEQPWPTYFFDFKGLVGGKPRVFNGVGDGCGIGDWADMGEGLTITKID
jgi:hypothetical protein